MKKEVLWIRQEATDSQIEGILKQRDALIEKVKGLQKIRVRAADVVHWFNLFEGNEDFEAHIRALDLVLVAYTKEFEPQKRSEPK